MYVSQILADAIKRTWCQGRWAEWVVSGSKLKRAPNDAEKLVHFTSASQEQHQYQSSVWVPTHSKISAICTNVHFLETDRNKADQSHETEKNSTSNQAKPRTWSTTSSLSREAASSELRFDCSMWSTLATRALSKSSNCEGAGKALCSSHQRLTHGTRMLADTNIQTRIWGWVNIYMKNKRA